MRRSASEIINDLEMRVARLEKQSANPLLVLSGRNYLLNEFEYKEEIEYDERQLIGEIEKAFAFEYNTLSIEVKDVAIVDGGVKFKFEGVASVPATVIPAPFSMDKIFDALEKTPGKKFLNQGDLLIMRPDENSTFGRAYYDELDDFDGPPIYFELRLKGNTWEFKVWLEVEGIFSDEFDRLAKRGYFNFKVKSTGNNKKDIKLLLPLLEKAYRDIHTTK